jgi:hypothetical protein
MLIGAKPTASATVAADSRSGTFFVMFSPARRNGPVFRVQVNSTSEETPDPTISLRLWDFHVKKTMLSLQESSIA